MVGGASALQFCSPSPSYSPTTLDIYAPVERSEDVVEHLTVIEHYWQKSKRFPEDETEHDEIPSEDDDLDVIGPSYGVASSTTFRRGKVEVVLHQCLSGCPTLPIPQRPCTVEMVFLTENAACVLYPGHVEQRRGLLNPKRFPYRTPVDDDHPAKEHVEDLERSGYDIADCEIDWRGPRPRGKPCAVKQNPACASAVRHVGDAACLVASFATVGGRTGVPALPLYVTEWAPVWWRGGMMCVPPCAAAMTHFRAALWVQRFPG